MARGTSTVSVQQRSGRGNTAVEVEDARDREFIHDIFAHWPNKHLQVLADGIGDLLTLGGEDRKALADKEAADCDWAYDHPAAAHRRYLREQAARQKVS